MEITSSLRELFTAYRERQPEAVLSSSSHTPSVARTENAQRLADAIHSVQQLVEKSLVTCQRRIRATLEAMDECSPFAASCEKTLLLSEAELATADASIKALVGALKTARSANGAPSHEPAEHDEEEEANSWLRHALAKTARGKARSNETPGQSIPDDQLSHFDALVGVLTSRLSQSQLRLALCKEELALYKNERYAFGRCGVLACRDPSAASTATRESSHGEPLTATASAARSPVRGPPARHRVAGFGFVTDVSKMTINTVDEVFRKTSSTVKEAGARAADTTFGAALSTLRAGMGQLDVDLFAEKKRNGGVADTDVAVAAPRAFDFTEDERTALEHQNADLVLEQREASTLEAKAIETSVRELAQLTTLMNEKVVEQSEQFSILLKNTDAAHRNVKKALEEVQKPKKAYWSATRQLIALLWLCTFVLLVANWWIR